MQLARKANARLPEIKTAQGHYIAGADGTSYGFQNNHILGYVRPFVENGLKKFKDNPPQKVEITDAEKAAPFTRTPDPGTSIVRVFTRIRPLPADVHAINAGVGRDHLWILQKETRQIIAAAHDDGKDFELPETMLARMLRFNLIDNVRGEPDMWKAGDVKKASFAAKMISQDAQVKTYAFDGQFEFKLADDSRGQDGVLHGEFSIDKQSVKITRFRAYSEGSAFGHSQYTPREPQGHFPLIVAMIETDDWISKIVPPQGHYIDDYFKPSLGSAVVKNK